MKTKRPRNPKPLGRTPGPVTNRRKGNEPLRPAKGGKFHQRAPRSPVDDPGPDDLTHFDAGPDLAEFFDSRAILERSDE